MMYKYNSVDIVHSNSAKSIETVQGLPSFHTRDYELNGDHTGSKAERIHIFGRSERCRKEMKLGKSLE